MNRCARYGSPALVLALLVAGCGGGSSSKPDVAPTKAAATKAANAINLVAADLPGYKSDSSDAGDDANDPDASDKALSTCLGIPISTDDVVDITSDEFDKGEDPMAISASSEVEIVKSLADAKQALKAFMSSKAIPCLQTSFATEIKSESGDTKGITYGTPAITRTSGPSAGTDGDFGFDITVPFTASGQSFSVDLTETGFLKGHSEITLMTTAFGATFPASERTDLLNLLVKRAKASAV